MPRTNISGQRTKGPVGLVSSWYGCSLFTSVGLGVLGKLGAESPCPLSTNYICSAWIVVAEVWPLSARPYGIALGASSNWMNNFIVGQVTPDMITGITYGTFILFGCLITLGAAFIWFYGKCNFILIPPHSILTVRTVPETKQLTLEEMDLIFGSSGVATADQERMAQINAEIGLTRRLSAVGGESGSNEKIATLDEKTSDEKTI